MNDEVIDSLLKRIGALEDRQVLHRTGVVTVASPLAVALGGSSVAYSPISTHVPGLKVGDVVSVQTFGNDQVVTGRIGGPEGWHIVGAAGEPAFTNAWVRFDAAATRQPRFRKDPFGKVTLAGLMKTGASATSAFTLPAGYRPVTASGEEWAVSSSGSAARIQVLSTGAVTPLDQTGSAVTTLVYLNGVEFYAEA